MAREELERHALDICARLQNHVPTNAPVTTWALQIAQSALRSDVEEMTKKIHGLHFDARVAMAEQIESTFMPRLADKMRQVAPCLWSLVFNLLGALDERRSSLTVDPVSMNLAKIFEDSERNLGEIGGDMDVEDGEGERDGNESDPEPEEDMPHRKRSRKDVSSRNTAIRVIVSYNDIEALRVALWIVNLQSGGSNTRNVSFASVLFSRVQTKTVITSKGSLGSSSIQQMSLSASPKS